MRVIIAGSRDRVTRADVDHAMASASVEGIVPTVVLSGAARGADQHGEAWARDCGITVEQYPADWRRYPRTAGLIRNGEMATRADALVAIWDGASTGTLDMIRRAQYRGLRVYIHRV